MLTYEFFEKREKTLDGYRAKGYLPLGEFLQQTGVTEQQLFNAGLIEMKQISVTTDLYDYCVTEKGKKYLKELKRMQLIMVLKKKLEELRVVL